MLALLAPAAIGAMAPPVLADVAADTVAEFAVQAELELGENVDYPERHGVEDRCFAKLAFRFR